MDWDEDESGLPETIGGTAYPDSDVLPEARDVYTSSNLHASAIIFDQEAPLCICFPPRGTTRRPFGIEFALKHRLNWLGVTCRGNDWLQYPDLEELEAAVRDFGKDFKRVVTYGSSHGGFAAIVCADRMGADAVLAVVPQTFIGENCPREEARWSLD